MCNDGSGGMNVSQGIRVANGAYNGQNENAVRKILVVSFLLKCCAV